MVREKIQKVTKEIRTIQAEVYKSLVTLVTAAFGFVAAFAWNETMKTTFLQYYGDADGIAGRFFYAIIVTILAVTITIWLGRISGKKKVEEEQNKPVESAKRQAM